MSREGCADAGLAVAHRELSRAFETAYRVPFDHSSRIIFMSDCHRGDGGRADAFAVNEALYLHALTHYYRQGFTYVEVGDGDELWKYRRFGDVYRAHQRVFDLLHRFDEQGRLHLIVGNHDIAGDRHSKVEKNGLAVREAIVLEHVRTGQQVLVAHGHQADFTTDRSFATGQRVVRYVWRPLQSLGFGRTPIWAQDGFHPGPLERRIIRDVHTHKIRIERRILTWLKPRHQTVICGHTHRPSFAVPGAAAYYNAGCCLIPGQITGLEVRDDCIALVQWSAGPMHLERRLLAPPRELLHLTREKTSGAFRTPEVPPQAEKPEKERQAAETRR
jgi:UDP-2,3-diacylglucosamine pyrophosphatase LpxH